MNKKPYRLEFRLDHEIDADIIDFIERDGRTNVGMFRDAVRLLMQVESGKQPLDAEGVLEVVKGAMSVELLGDVIRSVLAEYEMQPAGKKAKTKKPLGFNAMKL